MFTFFFFRCRPSQKKFDTCVFENLGWVRPELGDLGKVRYFFNMSTELYMYLERPTSYS